MKAASAATLAILSGGQYVRTDLYSITLTTGATYYFTNGDVPISCEVYTAAGFGTSQNYISGFVFDRGATTQAVGLDAQEMELTISPNWDNPGGPPTIAGYSIAQAARLGLLDNAIIGYYKLFMNFPLPGAQFDATPGAIACFTGLAAEIVIKRFSVEIKVSSDLLVLNQVQMPKNLYQAGCTHTVYDAGCTLSKASFSVSGTVGTVTSNSLFNTNLTQANDYFDLGVIKFTSGLNNGYSATIKQFTHTSGVVSLMIPMPATVANGDTFTIYPGCDHQQATCSGKFSNIAHFKGMPYVPVPETLYDGGTSQPTVGNSPGKQAGNIAGSGISGRIL